MGADLGGRSLGTDHQHGDHRSALEISRCLEAYPCQDHEQGATVEEGKEVSGLLKIVPPNLEHLSDSFLTQPLRAKRSPFQLQIFC